MTVATSIPRRLSVSLTLMRVLLKVGRVMDGSFHPLIIHLFINSTYIEFLLCARHLLSPGYMAVNKQENPCLKEVMVSMLRSYILNKK